jgi:hypothetical protein
MYRISITRCLYIWNLCTGVCTAQLIDAIACEHVLYMHVHARQDSIMDSDIRAGDQHSCFESHEFSGLCAAIYHDHGICKSVERQNNSIELTTIIQSIYKALLKRGPSNLRVCCRA